MAGGGVADDKFESNEDGGVEACTEDCGGACAEENGRQGLKQVPTWGCFWFYNDKPKSVEGGEEIVNGEKFGPGEIGEKNKRETNNKVD